MSARIWLGTSGSETLLIPSGRKLTENDIEITRQGRTASAKLVKDVIATKKHFSLQYEQTTNAVMEQLETAYAIGTTLNLQIERKDATVDDYAVLMGPIQRGRINAIGPWLVGVSVELEEV